MSPKLFFGVLLLVAVIAAQAAEQHLNNRPIIGVLLQEQHDNVHQYVASSYIKWIEMAGARVVPIFIKRQHTYYSHLLDQVNGVLMPGGGTPLLHSGYSTAADLIFETAINKHKKGIYFPVWSSCLGFEKLVTYFTGNKDIKWETMCNVENVSLKLDFESGISTKTTKLFTGAEHIFQILQQYNVTPNYHRVCLAVDTFKKNSNLTEQFTLVSTNTYGGVHFVSTLEHKKYPIYATQWHPEKNQFEWVVSKTIGAINHDYNAIQVGQYFGNFFVNEARRNGQRFANATEEADALIYNYSHRLKYSGKTGAGSFEEIYVWPI